ncbi:MAG: VWA domain-containing protein [Deltaproteobacteria bacterium]|nr:VWA domain-containing protein [Deltaproteobacteria bacterium]
MKTASVFLLLPFWVGCVGDTPGGSMGPPDPSRIIVFYQSTIDGLVRGSGSPGALGPEAKYVYVAAHPSETVTVPEVRPDGSFFFAISASGRDVLEIAGARDIQGEERGSPVFLSIPPTPLPAQDFICCIADGAEEGNCQSADAERICAASGVFLSRCRSDRDCAQYAGSSISLGPDAITITPPNEAGRSIISGVAGKLPPFALVNIENRGQSGVGGALPRFRTGTITAVDGSFSIEAFARADDEFVFQVHDYEGYRSLRHAVYVPDSEVTNLDVVGVFPYTPLGEGRLGRVAIRFAPAGKDSRGICPDSDEAPALCFSGGKVGEGKVDGGLDFAMIQLNQFKIGGTPVTDAAPAVTSQDFPINKFTDGDLLGGPQTMVLVIELSLEAFASGRAPGQLTGPGANFVSMMSAARYFVSSLRSRDRLGIVIFGLDATAKVYADPTSDRAALFSALDRATRDAELGATGTNRARFFNAILESCKTLKGIPRLERGSIVGLVLSDPTDPGEIIPDVLACVTPDPDTGEKGFPVYIASAGLQNGFRSIDLGDVAQFSLGTYVNAEDAAGMLQVVAELTGRVSGAYILVYDMTIPVGVGKTPPVEVDAALTLPQYDGTSKTVDGSFQGILEVRDAPGP